MSVEKSKIMIFGGSGYLGRCMVRASVSLGHLTFVYARPLDSHNPTSKSVLLKEFESMGVTIFYLDEHEKLVSATLLEIRFQLILLTIFFILITILLKFWFMELVKPRSNMHDVVVFNCEEDVAAYTVKAATDPRAADHVIIYRPPENITSRSELISTWEKKIALPFPENIPVAVLHNIFIKGDQLKEEDLKASKLYPDYKYTSIDKYLDMCLVDPPQPKLGAFA
ncbi:Detected protein of confused Function [Hibiscus syriacus]|uniref:Detected protein of confused Function n=1 Tax=Hibiscus syriacus TaxID=106335 RepID=A0A6A2ZC68_HIBSY|nr:Detected protein of confused Function [Hibiscus syriacus]